eukprot:CAMPEP_0175354756 /NCGR_PEP_ID=MMETSP0095-20121207/13121_1 /TAXON_ID=311494 /ORGANISM="Alexandrium monilatum, Strain CCMP3105" /LENGTH=317 /DNA_ID=CAMNT_0016652413 /DNA_START=68 /DNA_END=1021 /DNA_ORIENTATION=-
MTGKDQRSRQARRGRRGAREPEEAQPGLAEASSPPPTPAAADPPLPPAAAPMLPAAALRQPAMPVIGEDSQLEAGAKEGAAIEGPARSPTQRLLAKVPTPVRSPKSTDAMHKGLGPEPWSAADSAVLPATSAAKGGYREWLQARGQQAMQRSLMQGLSPGGRSQAPPPPPASPAPCPGALAGVLSVPSGPAQVQLQPWFGPGAALPPAGCGRPAMLLPGCSATATPLSGQQSPMAFGSLSHGGCTPTSAASSPAAAFGLCIQPQPVMATAAAAINQPPAECNQQELMAALMPGGFSGLDCQQIAEQLRAAAPCCYDD